MKLLSHNRILGFSDSWRQRQNQPSPFPSNCLWNSSAISFTPANRFTEIQVAATTLFATRSVIGGVLGRPRFRGVMYCICMRNMRGRNDQSYPSTKWLFFLPKTSTCWDGEMVASFSYLRRTVTECLRLSGAITLYFSVPFCSTRSRQGSEIQCSRTPYFSCAEALYMIADVSEEHFHLDLQDGVQNGDHTFVDILRGF